MESAQNSIQKASYLLALAEEEWNSGNATAAVRHWKQFLELYPKHPLHYLTCSEARRKTTIKGMKKDAAYFDAIIAPLEQAPK
jgi:HEPN domain-containing protein